MIIHKTDKAYQERLVISNKAFKGGHLIFSPKSQKWYTPREFLESNENVEYQRVGMDDFPNVNMFNPIDAIGRQMSILQKAQKDLDEVIIKVRTAFDINSKPPKTKKP